MKSSTLPSDNLHVSSKKAIISAVGVAVIGSIIQLLANGEPLYHIFPNMLFFTPFYDRAPNYYQDPATVLPEKTGHIKIPEIQACDYSDELMRKVSNGFREPVLIKGLFSDTVAVKNWTKPGHLKKKFGALKVLIYSKINRESAGLSLNPNSTVSSVGAAAEEILNNEYSETRIIFPQLALAEAEGTDPVALEAKSKELMEELNIGLISPGFGDENHHHLLARQIFMGRGHEGTQSYSGLGWHTEPANNWFIQVTGKKRWYFMAPRDSTLLLPKKRTARLIVTSDMKKITELDSRLPILYGDVEAGDMIYNPEWYWHKTQLFPGASISVSLREFYLFRNLRSSPMYSMQLFLSMVFELNGATYLKRFLKKWI